MRVVLKLCLPNSRKVEDSTGSDCERIAVYPQVLRCNELLPYASCPMRADVLVRPQFRRYSTALNGKSGLLKRRREEVTGAIAKHNIDNPICRRDMACHARSMSRVSKPSALQYSIPSIRRERRFPDR